MTLALFDFDGTVTKKDSLLHFTFFAKGALKFYFGIILLSPILILNKLGLVDAQKTKNIYLSWFFKNMSEDAFLSVAKKYAEEKLPSIVRNAALEKLNWHVKNGHRVILVSASPEDYLQKWCSKFGIECIATKLQKKEYKLTGQIDGINCKGPEKARRILSVVSLKEYEEIYGYGDSSGDNEMLVLCNKPFYKPFH